MYSMNHQQCLWRTLHHSLGDAFETCPLCFLHDLPVAPWARTPVPELSQCPNLTTVHTSLMAILHLNNSTFDSTCHAPAHFPFFSNNLKYHTMASCSSHLVWCSAYVFPASLLWQLHDPGLGLYFWCGLFCRNILIFSSLSCQSVTTRLIFLYWIYRLLLCLQLQDATFLIELYIKWLAWHLQQSYSAFLVFLTPAPPLCTLHLFLMGTIVWLFCCLCLCSVLHPSFSHEKLAHLRNVQIKGSVPWVRPPWYFWFLPSSEPSQLSSILW